jgi:hypothetical protein
MASLAYRIKANQDDPQRQFYAIISFREMRASQAIKSNLCGGAA